ncbi:SDR family NAD(P)-dependent oxidoreductase [Amycolatopsis eburnea]|uniref:SDR family NAD(P)-dependent oxidoreductase n=1 Tax=Amycolatopsis eburnea TaxID=2267691 RepID=A0A3R9EQ89_9PSEU|nr:SDR family NAD(P)-dependent oxidoreductase [Amycolatopsis eburnea]RSD14768.1 SDR family NAD(P)-dependent oxidoreductase [Amycolatopsis eburnea]
MTFLVTGTSSGIGRAIAVRLAEHGHEVVAGVRKIADAPAHPRIRPVELDVTDAAQLAAAAKDIGPLSGLVNNAGITVSAPVEHIPLDRLRAQFEVNVVGVVAVCQAFLPGVRAGRGRIVMISSSSGRVAIPLLGAYSASKFAVEALRTRCDRNCGRGTCPWWSSSPEVSSRGTGRAPRPRRRPTA